MLPGFSHSRSRGGNKCVAMCLYLSLPLDNNSIWEAVTCEKCIHSITQKSMVCEQTSIWENEVERLNRATLENQPVELRKGKAKHGRLLWGVWLYPKSKGWTPEVLRFPCSIHWSSISDTEHNKVFTKRQNLIASQDTENKTSPRIQSRWYQR